MKHCCTQLYRFDYSQTKESYDVPDGSRDTFQGTLSTGSLAAVRIGPHSDMQYLYLSMRGTARLTWT